MAQKKYLHALHTYIFEKYIGRITFTCFDRDNLEGQCQELDTDRGTGSNTNFNKLHDRLLIWNDDIFNLGNILKKFYVCIELKNKYKGVALTWLATLKYTSIDPGGNSYRDCIYGGPLVGLNTSVDSIGCQVFAKYLGHDRSILQ